MAALAYGPKLDTGPPGLAAKLLGFCEELRGEGVAVGTSEILDAFAALEEVPWTSRRTSARRWRRRSPSPRTTAASSSCSSSATSSAAAEAEAVERGLTRSRAAAPTSGGERLDIDELREAVREAIVERRRGAMRDLARLAIAAFGRQGEGSGVVGVDVQRIRRTLGLTRRHSSRRPRTGRRAAADRPRAAEPLRAPPAARARARPDRAHRDAAPLAPAGRARPGAADQPDPGPGRRPPRRRADEAAAGDPRARAARPPQGPGRSTCGGRCGPRWRPAACRCACATGRSGRGGRRSTSSATSRPRSPRPASSSSSVLHALHDSFRKLRSFVFIERISEVTDDLRARARLPPRSPSGSPARAASPTSPATPTTAASGSSS